MTKKPNASVDPSVDLIIGRWGAVGKANASGDPSVDLIISRWGAVGELIKRSQCV